MNKPTSTLELAIHAESLTKQFPKTSEASVKSLSFEIRPGETVAFLGPNGAGKSTTIKMLCGILSPSSGSARILGFEAGSREANMRLGLVFGTRSQLYMHMTVAHCLDLSAEIYYLTGEAKRSRISELADVFAITPFLNRRVRSLSLGERMRCEIVAALLHRPRVLLADEPTIGLDIVAKNSLREIIQHWQKHEKTTLMLTSHDLSDVEALCDRCILIDHGTKRFDGPIDGMKGQLKNLRRIRVTTSDADKKVMGDLTRFKMGEAENSFTHIYELFTDRIPMSEGLFALSKHYGDSLQDLNISEVTLEEVLGAQYARR
jgi:ABC-2 type transport system ATP-binding protein